MSPNQAYNGIAWACISSWYYGYHVTELNYPVNGLTCYPSSYGGHPLLPPCLGLDAFRYGTVTAALTAGGLAGSALSDRVVRTEGVHGGIAWTGWLNLAGALLMAGAPHWLVLALGRFVAGLSCGLAVCLVPPYLASLARMTPELSSRSGQIGTLHQLAIVLGICSSQIAGLLLTGPRGDIPGTWRYVVIIPGVFSLLQITLATRIANTPDDALSTSASPAVIGDAEAHVDATAPLLGSSALGSGTSASDQLTIRSLLSTPALRGPSVICAAIMCLQQLSGVNAVLFYSTPVLMSVIHSARAGVLSVSITVVNAIMTVPAIVLVDRVGRRSLLLYSIGGMAVISVLLAYGLDAQQETLSGFAIVTFIAAFAIGFGPVPFLLISELVPAPAVPALSSLALSASWISNFVVALVFLPLRDFLSSPVDPSDPLSARRGEGRVFYVFTVLLVVSFLVVVRAVKN